MSKESIITSNKVVRTHLADALKVKEIEEQVKKFEDKICIFEV